MKLSEAIRIGAKHVAGQQRSGGYFEPTKQGCLACAIGAAVIAVKECGTSWITHDIATEDVEVIFAGKIDNANAIFYTMAEHPIYREHRATIHDIVISLNDAHGWTFEQIADWLESIGY